MNDTNKKVKQHYDKVQKIYNLLWARKKSLGMHYGFWDSKTKTLDESIVNENKKIAEQLNIGNKDIILDAGCGIGGSAIWMAKKYGAKVIGITLSEKQVKIAKKNAHLNKVEPLTNFCAQDFCKTNFPNEYFSKIFAIESTCHVYNKNSFLKEFYRILKNDGQLVIADFFLVKDNLTKKEKEKIQIWCHGWEMSLIPTAKNFIKHLKENGFKNIKQIDQTDLTRRSSKKMYWRIGIFLGIILKILSWLKLHKSSGGTKATRSQYYLFKNGVVKYFIISATK